jgi:hypothetical protein
VEGPFAGKPGEILGGIRNPIILAEIGDLDKNGKKEK